MKSNLEASLHIMFPGGVEGSDGDRDGLVLADARKQRIHAKVQHVVLRFRHLATYNMFAPLRYNTQQLFLYTPDSIEKRCAE